MEISLTGVNDAFKRLINIFCGPTNTVSVPSRNGPVRMIEEPVLLRYANPLDRVLLYPGRDANPFFHVYEALWMLAGRNDVASVANYVSRMRTFSDDGQVLNGAYGYRWRHAKVADIYNENVEPVQDQLGILVDHLKDNPSSRRAVLQMWDVEDDLLKIGSDNPAYNLDGSARHFDADGNPVFPPGSHGRAGSRDVCCNLSVMFSIRSEGSDTVQADGEVSYLDMTVTNRSNDLIWGCLGANYVHFTVLQEYMARRIGVEVGVYNHFTNNLHAYEATWEPAKWFAGSEPLLEVTGDRVRLDTDDEEIRSFVSRNSDPAKESSAGFSSRFLSTVAGPMCRAYGHYKRGELYPAMDYANRVADPYWRAACEAWLRRRVK